MPVAGIMTLQLQEPLVGCPGGLADHFAVNLRNQRDNESIGGSQGGNYEMFCLLTERMILKSRLGDL